MRKVISTMLAALVAVSFSGMVFATEIPKSDQATTAAPASEVKAEKKEVKKCLKKHRKHKKLVIKKVEPAPAGPLPPTTK